MLGLIVTLLFTTLVTVAVWPWLKTFKSDWDPAEQVGIAGLLGLCLAGLLTLFVGLLPAGLTWGLAVVILVPALSVAWHLARKLETFPKLSVTPPQGLATLFPLVIVLFSFLPLVSVLAPSDSTDWDSLAYHLAVPKLWLQAGQIEYIQGIHHSNFPFTIDNLFIWGQLWGGQAGAKSFSLAFLILGCLAVFGFVRRHSSDIPAWWATLSFVSIPVVLWESGTAYIDVGHGLTTAFAFAYGAEAAAKILRKESPEKLAWLAGLLIGCALGSKFTGLQSLLAFSVTATIALIWGKQPAQGAKAVATIVAIGLLVSAPWFIRTTINTENPVYPFFYTILGGKDWDEWRAELYRDEQQSFGVGRTESGRDPTQIGHAVLGLAYQPGRYVNPGQTQGMGFPTGAIGFASVLTLFLVALYGNRRAEETILLTSVGILLLLWFFLSQQSRYLTIVAIPSCLLLGLTFARIPWAKLLAGAVSLQATYTGWLLVNTETIEKLPVVLGQVSPEDFQKRRISFFEPATAINQDQTVKKVALYDEVFGYLLDKPYFWANPGHSKKIPYETLEEGSAYAESMSNLGFSHIYLNLQFMPSEARERWLQAAGLTPGEPYSEAERREMMKDLNLRWRLLLAEANRQGHFSLHQQFQRSLLFRISVTRPE
ncbi:MAG: hypothetical protein MUC92_03165 [Fimbriimonadaceae bacterium]|jgi:4-amino-4-deoxy-L-arabinose transferase-like glycosyltransferase|nr:hypothetical protein [Fimbriimonadaceae bacterium]